MRLFLRLHKKKRAMGTRCSSPKSIKKFGALAFLLFLFLYLMGNKMMLALMGGIRALPRMREMNQ
ncbi:hypothetical protein AWU65_01395 [Paenibacillus glucanolyticus]|uniref:Uncharacterized protein n=1 Tax=Paenibacillus glucanolyticus TaxID=59843 RepID=A0A163DL54_9BACL|nr:hypothetical protein B9D94_13235 [Paenibacillus sp. Cedars]KZS43302.1 hypothetical protein AWU65_01395 [Paenibacillus glucanolyticus]